MNYISFPGLGIIQLHVNRVAFSLYGITIYWYGIIIATAIMIGMLLAIKKSKKVGINGDDVLDIMLVAIPAAIIGARLYFVIFNLSDYKSFMDVINVRNGGLAIYGGIIGGLGGGFIMAKVKKINFLNLLDLCFPYLALAQAIGRWGNFFNQEAFGANTTLPWGMQGNEIKTQLEILSKNNTNIDPQIPVHPTFLYESLWNLMVFGLLIWVSKRRKFSGEVFFLYMVFYGIGRFWIENLRLDSLMLGSIRVSQALSLILVLVFLILFIIRRRKSVAVSGIKFGSTNYGDIFGNKNNNEYNGKKSTQKNDSRL